MSGTDGHTVAAGAAPRSDRSAAATLAAVAVAPLVWFVHLNVSYLLVPPACGSGGRWWFAPVTVLALALMAPGALIGWRRWRDTEATALVRFLGVAGVALAALFALATVLVGASALVVSPCR